MPVVPSAQLGAWVRMPPPKKRAASPQKQAEAMRTGALSYFACMPQPPSKLPSANRGGGGGGGGGSPSFPKYDLDDDIVVPKTRGTRPGHQSRAFSAPGSGPRSRRSRIDQASQDEDDDDEDDEHDFNHGDPYHDEAISTRSRERVRTPGHRHQPSRPRGDSYTSGGSSSGGGSGSSTHSYRRTTAPPSPTPSRPQPAASGARYWTGPSNRYTGEHANRSSTSAATARRTGGDRWASATQPLVF